MYARKSCNQFVDYHEIRIADMIEKIIQILVIFRCTADTRRRANVRSMLGHRCRRWPDIEQSLASRLLFSVRFGIFMLQFWWHVLWPVASPTAFGDVTVDTSGPRQTEEAAHFTSEQLPPFALSRHNTG